MSGYTTAVLMVGGTLLSTAGQIQQANAAEAQGIAQQQAADYQAEQMRVNAGQERAMSQRRAIEASREKRLTQNSLITRAAASGGGTLDGSVVKIMGDLEEEGEYNKGVALYEGEERARDLESGAAIQTYEGEQAKIAGKMRKRAGYLEAGSTLLSGSSKAYGSYKEASGQSFYDKYNG